MVARLHSFIRGAQTVGFALAGQKHVFDVAVRRTKLDTEQHVIRFAKSAAMPDEAAAKSILQAADICSLPQNRFQQNGILDSQFLDSSLRSCAQPNVIGKAATRYAGSQIPRVIGRQRIKYSP